MSKKKTLPVVTDVRSREFNDFVDLLTLDVERASAVVRTFESLFERFDDGDVDPPPGAIWEGLKIVAQKLDDDLDKIKGRITELAEMVTEGRAGVAVQEGAAR